MEAQCVTADQIADAFMILLRADQQFLIVTVAVVVFIMSAPGLLHRWLDRRDDRKAQA